MIKSHQIAHYGRLTVTFTIVKFFTKSKFVRSSIIVNSGDMIYDENNYPLNILQDSNNILKSIKQEKDVLLACASRLVSWFSNVSFISTL